LRPLKVIIDNYEDGKTEELEVEINPNKPELGSKTVTFSKEIYIEQDDFMLDPPGKYFRLCPAKEVRLKGAYFIKYASHETDENGNITAVHCTYDPETKGGDAPDGRKVKGTLHWISAETAKKATVRLYDRLFLVENPSDEEGVSSFADNLNPESLQIIENALIESDVANAKPGEVFQFMRQGYFAIDTDSTKDNIIINRTVALKDSFSVKK
jgi:glutaminyl-tRNA synthetase